MNRNCINLSELSERIGCSFSDVEVKPGVIIRQTHWSKADYLAARELLREQLQSGAGPVSIYGSPDPWNTVALVRELGVTYSYPFPGHPEELTMDLNPLSVGTSGENYGVQYEIREEGEKVFINMTSDDPSLPHGEGTPHTFLLSNVTRVHAPEIAPGKDVFLHGWGMYSVMCAVAATLAETARSVFLASHETDYFCCATRTPDYEIGDRMPRTWENALPHC